MTFRFLIWISVLLLLAQPISALTTDEINALVDSIVLYAQQTGSCSNSTTSQTGTVTGSPAVQSIAGDITGSCDYTTSDAVSWPGAGKLDSMLNQTHSIWTDDSNTNWGSPYAILGRGYNDGQFRMERDNTLNVFRVTFYSSGQSAQASAADASITANTGFKLLSASVNVSNAANKMSSYFVHNSTINAEGTLTDAFGSSNANIFLNARESNTMRGIQSIAAYVVFNKTLNSNEYDYVVAEFTAGRHLEAAAPPPVDPDEQEFTITALDTYDGVSLDNITITIFNSSNSFDLTTDNGTIIVSNKTSLESFNVTYDITFSSNQSGGYLNHTFSSINFSDGGSFIGDLYQAILRINATEIVSRTIITDFFASVPLQSNQSNSSGFATLLLKAGNYNVTGNKTGFLNSTSINISINALDDIFLTLEFATHRLRIDAKDKFSNQSISSFNVTITGLNITHSKTKGTTTGNISFDIETGNFTIDIFGNDNYALESANVSVDATFTNHTFLLFPRNSILITVYEEGTSIQIGDIGVTDNRTTTADFDSTLQVLNLSSQNGTILAEGIIPTDYTITIGSSGFDSRQYFVTLISDSHVGLSAYISNSTDTTAITFTVKDISNQKELPNIRISVSDKINLTYVTIDQKDTDIAGQAEFDLDQTKTYRFTMSGGGYETRTFNLLPLTTAYTIELTPFAKIDFTTIFDSVDFVTLPISSIIINNTDLINFSIITTSLTGITIKHFGLNTTYQGTLSLTNVSGSAGGGTASIFLNLSNMTGSVGVTYFIDIDGDIPFILDRKFFVSNVTATNQSMEVSLKDLSDKVGQPLGAIIGTIFVLLIMATFSSMGLRDRRLNVIGAVAIGFLGLYGFFNGWIALTVITGLMMAYFMGGLRGDDD